MHPPVKPDLAHKTAFASPGLPNGARSNPTDHRSTTTIQPTPALKGLSLPDQVIKRFLYNLAEEKGDNESRGGSKEVHRSYPQCSARRTTGEGGDTTHPAVLELAYEDTF